MINVGVIGLGMMGGTHLDVYGKLKDVRVVAISDADPARLSGKQKAAGNIKGQAQGGLDLSQAKRYAEGMELIRDGDVQVVDICLPTPLHADYAVAALKAGKHVLVEKPLARTGQQAKRLVRAAAQARTVIMPAMCIRFWPGWDWLQQAVAKRTYGRVLAASFRRLAPHPGGPFYSNGKLCGGALLDLHIHDTDFIQWCFGMPKAVSSGGYTRVSGAIDHVCTRYDYGKRGPVVTAEGSWVMAPGFPFTMQYTVNFEKATAIYDLAAPSPLTLCRDGKAEAVALPAGMGYEHEIVYFLDCVKRKKAPRTVTVAEAARSVALVEAEAKSIAAGGKRIPCKA